MFNNITLAFTVFLFSYPIFAQDYMGNLIPNGNFEEHTLHPCSQDQMNRCKEWSAFGSGTSDYYCDLSVGYPCIIPFHGDCFEGFNGGDDNLSASNGHFYTGFGGCEGIVGHFPANISATCPYRFSFDFSPRQPINSEFHVYFLETEPSNTSLGVTNPSGCSSPSVLPIIELVVPVSIQNNAQCSWSHFETVFNTLPSNIHFIAIKGPNENGIFGAGNYMYVDNVKLQAIPYCQHDCIEEEFHAPYIQIATANGTFENPIPCNNNDNASCNPSGDVCQMPNAGIANSVPWGFTLFEAYRYRLEIYNRWGNLVYLKDESTCCGFQDKIIFWNGFWNQGANSGTPANTDAANTFSYQFAAWGCDTPPNYSGWNQSCYDCPGGCNGNFEGANLFYAGEIAMVRNGDNDIVTENYDWSCDPSLLECCQLNYYCTNSILATQILRKVDNDIATSNTQIAPSGNVEFRAGKSVRLGTGFKTLPNARFKASIADCNTVSNNRLINSSNKLESITSIKDSNANYDLSGLLFAKLPIHFTNNRLSAVSKTANTAEENSKLQIVRTGDVQTIVYTLPKQEKVSMQIVDITGKLLVSVIENSMQFSGVHRVPINTQIFPSGIYLCILKTEDEKLTAKLVVQ